MKPLRLALIAGVSLIATAACAVGPRYQAPSTPPVAVINAAPEIASAAEPQAAWWAAFGDPVLDDLVRQALTRNADLQVAAANLAKARATLQEARAGRFPTTQVEASAIYGKSATANLLAGLEGTRARAGWYYDGAFDASYEVDLFGRISSAIRAARADAEAVRAAQDVARVSVAAETARAYADACAYAAELDTARRSLAAAQDLYDLTVRRRTLGAVSDFEVASAGATLEQARGATPTLDGEWRSSLFELAVLTGRPPEEVSAEAAACRAPPRLSRLLPVGDGSAMLRRRPDVRQAERTAAADVARIGVAMADLFPKVSLTGTAAQGGANGKQLTSSTGFSFGVGPLITWSFPNLLTAAAQLGEARAQASASIARFDSVVLNALKETEQALTAYNGELQRRAALAAARDHAAEAYRLAQVQFDNGAISFPDLLATERIMIQAEAELAASDQALVSDQVSVFKALGGGWEDAPQAVAPKA